MTTAAFSLQQPAPPILAMGAWFKNTVCAVRVTEARLSALIGDLDSADACTAHESAAAALLDWMDELPVLIAHDLHPDFHSSRHAADLAQQLGVPALPVQHHHAHIAAVCAEHGWRGPLLGLALDGVGLGNDGTAWGGELLLVDGARCERAGHLWPLALPGGDRAAREPWRMAASVFHAQGRNGDIATRFEAAAGLSAAAMVATMLERNINSPRTSSMGRVFDAAAGLLGLCTHMNFEAEAAIALEQAATRHIESCKPVGAGHARDNKGSRAWPAPTKPAYQGDGILVDGWRIDNGILNLCPLLMHLDGAADVDAAAAVFHATLVAALADWVVRAAEARGIATVAWGGGCFLNRLLSSGLKQKLEAAGLSVLTPLKLSPGDACIAAGQAWVAICSLEH